MSPAVDTIKIRGGTAALWTSRNPILAARELAVETDTLQMKVGDGVTAWTALAYVSGSGGGGSDVFDPTGTDLIATTKTAAIRELDADRDSDAAETIAAARAGVLLVTDQPLLVGKGNWADNSEQTMDRDHISGSLTCTASTLFLSYFTAQQTRAGLTAIKVCTFTPGASPTPSLAKLGLYSVDPTTGDLTLIAASTNDTALFSVANTLYTKTIAASSITKGNRYAIGLLQVGSTTAPKVFGCVTTGVLTLDAPVIAAQVAQTDMPSTIAAASLVATAGRIWARLS